jgi:WhiB family transcriptional regulator, redox-sensing transcriptional regulator
VDPRPAWERVAYTWLAREVDGGHQVDPAALAAEVSVTPRLATDLVRVLRAQRQRDPGLSALRGRLVRDRITETYLARELRGGQRLDPALLAAELGTTATIARQWLRSLREVRDHDPTLTSLRTVPEDHGRVHADQLVALAERFRAGSPAPAVAERPLPTASVADNVELLWRRHELHGDQRLDPAEVARELGTSRAYVATTLATLRAGATPTTRQRIEALWQARELQGGRWVSSRELAAELHTSADYASRVVRELRAAHRASPTAPPSAPARADAPEAAGEGPSWLARAACRDTDPELFFPERGQKAKAQAAKQVCATCQVTADCLELAVKGAASRGEDHGIFGGTKPHERTGLRDNQPAQASPWRRDRELAEQAHRLATQVGPQQAARELGTAPTTLARAWAQWGLEYPGRPRRSVFAHDREQAERAFRLATQLGSIKRAARQLGSSRPALLAGWQRFNLGMPETTRTAKPGHNNQPAARLDPAFVKLNQGSIPVRARSDDELAQRVRRAEEIATLGAGAVGEMNAESRAARAGARMWAVQRRAARAQRLVSDRASRPARRQAERAERHAQAGASRAERSPRPHHPHRDEREVFPDAR